MSDHEHEKGAHRHGVSADADRRWLVVALLLISGFMAAEVAVALAVGSLALLSDAAHMLTDAAAIAVALVAMKLADRPAAGGFTYGLKRVEILSAMANGTTLLVLSVWLGVEAISRLLDPQGVPGWPVLATALSGVAVNVLAVLAMSRSDRSSLNVDGAFKHVLTDLFAFIATAIAGVVILTTGFVRADALASLVVVVLMVKAGVELVAASARIFLEAAPAGLDPHEIGQTMAAIEHVREVHDLHVWTITSGEAALSAHVLVSPDEDCHAVREALQSMLSTTYRLAHATLQVDHIGDRDEHCEKPHGIVHHGA